MRSIVFLLLLAPSTRSQDHLPPVAPWSGKSLQLARPADHPWATPFEKSGLKATPRYDETVAWLQRLAAAAPELQMVTLGKSDEGRHIWMVIASAERQFRPEALRRSGKPILFVQAGIHSGEIDGKDAGMMLLRDLTVVGTKKALLEKVNLLFIPILNVDGHERFGKHQRVNQRGPVEMGWRTNARNLNLNRDYGKLDTAGVRAAVRVLSVWQPDLYYDIHVTDGADYQYDITWGYNGAHSHSPAAARWLARWLDPALQRDLAAWGHIPGPLVFALDGADMTKGTALPTMGVRFSNGYGDARHLPTVLVENHSLKPYRQRVLGTYVLLEATMRLLGERGAELRAATRKDRASRRPTVPLTWQRGEPHDIEFLGISQKKTHSEITGGDRVVWTGEPVTLTIPQFPSDVPELIAKRPRAYWIPPAWTEVIARLKWHGIEFERLKEPRTVDVELDHVDSFELGKSTYEGRVRVTAQLTTRRRRQTYPRGSVRVPTDQPLGDLAILLLDPRAPDSFFQWGFFPGILQRTEYVENYAMIPLAERMLARDAKLRKAYDQALQDEAFAKNPRARLQWLDERSPYFDTRYRIIPVGRQGPP